MNKTNTIAAPVPFEQLLIIHSSFFSIHHILWKKQKSVRTNIRKTINSEMDLLMEYKDNDIAQREIRLFNEILSQMSKTDRRGEEIFDEYGFKRECREINGTEG